MGAIKDIKEAEAFVKKDRFATLAGVEVDEIGDGYCICSMQIKDMHKNGMDNVMGGAIFTLADITFALASNNMHMMTVAQQVSVNYLSAAKGDKLIADARCKKDGRTSCVYNIDIKDNTGRDVAQFVGTGYKL